MSCWLTGNLMMTTRLRITSFLLLGFFGGHFHLYKTGHNGVRQETKGGREREVRHATEVFSLNQTVQTGIIL